MHEIAGDRPDAARNIRNCENERWPDQKDHSRHERVCIEHHANQADKRDEIPRNRCDRHVQEVANTIDVLVDLSC